MTLELYCLCRESHLIYTLLCKLLSMPEGVVLPQACLAAREKIPISFNHEPSYKSIVTFFLNKIVLLYVTFSQIIDHHYVFPLTFISLNQSSLNTLFCQIKICNKFPCYFLTTLIFQFSSRIFHYSSRIFRILYLILRQITKLFAFSRFYNFYYIFSYSISSYFFINSFSLGELLTSSGNFPKK